MFILKINKIFIIMFLLSLLIFTFGVYAGLYRNSIYSLLREIKQSIISQEIIVIDNAKLNNYGQLIWYYDKIQVNRPEITNKTLIIFTFGQSNSANHGGEKYYQTNKNITNYFDGKFFLASDPLLGSTGISGSVWTNFGDKLIKNSLAESVILITAGVGSSSIKDWSSGGQLNKMLINRLNDLKKNNLNIEYFLWHQGESDVSLSTDAYLNKLINIINLTKEYFPKSKFLVAQATSCGIVTFSPSIQKAQNIITKKDNVFLGPNTDQIGYKDRFDGCHLSARGLEIHAQKWIDSIIVKKKYEH